jgi:hypothetical protein
MTSLILDKTSIKLILVQLKSVGSTISCNQIFFV